VNFYHEELSVAFPHVGVVTFKVKMKVGIINLTIGGIVGDRVIGMLIEVYFGVC
jgi:hypothetical protein